MIEDRLAARIERGLDTVGLDALLYRLITDVECTAQEAVPDAHGRVSNR